MNHKMKGTNKSSTHKVAQYSYGIFRLVPLIMLFMLLLALLPSASAALCEDKVIAYGTCTPVGSLDVYNNGNHIASQSKGFLSGCSNGFYVIELGPAGSDSSCAIESAYNDLYFEIDGIPASIDRNGIPATSATWTSGLLLRLDLDAVPVTIPPIPPIVPPNIPPIITADFNHGVSLTAGHIGQCSAHIEDPDSTLTEISWRLESAVDRVTYSGNWSQNILNTGDCVVSSNGAIADCAVNVSAYYPVGDVECIFFARDSVGDHSDATAATTLVNTPPTLIQRVLNYVAPYTSQISIQLGVHDPDVQQNLSYTTTFPRGFLDPSTGLYTWSPSVNETGNYAAQFAVSDGVDSDRKIINFAIGLGTTSTQVVAPAASCRDGVQNQNETGVDCGGPCTVSCPVPVSQASSGGSGSGGSSGSSVGSGSSGSGGGSCLTQWKAVQTLQEACTGLAGGIEVKIRDYSTICPNQTDPSLRNVYRIRTEKCPLLESCFDTVRNQNELGIDCGGSCTACASCSDGVKNQNELGIDCGGSCSTACMTCSDGIKNRDEEDVDCGGIYCASCQKPKAAAPSRWWLWVLLALVLVILVVFGLYELEQKGLMPPLFTKTSRDRFSGGFQGNSSFSSASPSLASSSKSPPAFSARTVSVASLKKEIAAAESLLSKGKTEELKGAVAAIVAEYRKLSPAQRSEIYPTYMKLYDKIRAR